MIKINGITLENTYTRNVSIINNRVIVDGSSMSGDIKVK